MLNNSVVFDEDIQKSYNVRGGVFIDVVLYDSVAQRNGFSEGDIILRVNNTEVYNSTHFLELLKAIDSNKTVFTILHYGVMCERVVTF